MIAYIITYVHLLITRKKFVAFFPQIFAHYFSTHQNSLILHHIVCMSYTLVSLVVCVKSHPCLMVR